MSAAAILNDEQGVKRSLHLLGLCSMTVFPESNSCTRKQASRSANAFGKSGSAWAGRASSSVSARCMGSRVRDWGELVKSLIPIRAGRVGDASTRLIAILPKIVSQLQVISSPSSHSRERKQAPNFLAEQASKQTCERAQKRRVFAAAGDFDQNVHVIVCNS